MKEYAIVEVIYVREPLTGESHNQFQIRTESKTLEQFNTPNPIILEIVKNNDGIDKSESQIIKIKDREKDETTLKEIENKYPEIKFNWKEVIDHFEYISNAAVIEKDKTIRDTEIRRKLAKISPNHQT
jgi:hypothetical protein